MTIHLQFIVGFFVGVVTVAFIGGIVGTATERGRRLERARLYGPPDPDPDFQAGREVP
jgi:hypothetical protein